jgi:hypothetical protein
MLLHLLQRIIKNPKSGLLKINAQTLFTGYKSLVYTVIHIK